MRLTLFLFVSLLLMPLTASGFPQRPIHQISGIKIGPMQVKDVRIGEFISELFSRAHLLFCLEQVRGSHDMESKITLTVAEGESLDDVLNQLQQQYPIIQWSIEENVIVIQTVSARRLNDNPLDAEIAPFEFDGNLNSLLSYLNQRVPGLSAMSGTETAQIYEVQYHFKFDSNATVRDVLCALTRDYGVRWNADIERTVPVQRSTGSLITLMNRVSLLFLQQDLPTLVAVNREGIYGSPFKPFRPVLRSLPGFPESIPFLESGN
jgi:hypothetical protein